MKQVYPKIHWQIYSINTFRTSVNKELASDQVNYLHIHVKSVNAYSQKTKLTTIKKLHFKHTVSITYVSGKSVKKSNWDALNPKSQLL